MKSWLKPSLILLCLLLTACSFTPSPPAPPPTNLRVGVTAGPHTEILYAVREAAETQGFTFDIAEIGDYDSPNQLLDKGQLEVNSFQNHLYLQRVIYDRNYDFVPIAQTIYFPMGIYSKQQRALTDLPLKCSISLPQEPMARDRAIDLLIQSGLPLPKDLIPWQSEATLTVGRRTFELRFRDSLTLPDSLEDSDLVVIHAPVAVAKGLTPSKDALTLESPITAYTHVLVVRRDRSQDPALQQLIAAYHSDFVKSYILRRFGGSVLPAW